MFKKVQPGMDFQSMEQSVLDFWKREDVQKKAYAHNADSSRVFTFYDGPPTANGKPHVGHIISRAVKDLFPRYHSMKGEYVLRKAGWDTHGLPVELEVEKLLGLDGKPQIEAYGIQPFIEECKKSVWKYQGEWEKMSERVAFWADMEHPYITYENNYIESVWWSLKQIFDAGLLYKGYKVVPYCPRCGTALSSHEVAQGYKDVTEPSVFVRFPVSGETNIYFIAWTTTPWTLPSNVALAVHPEEEYLYAKVGDDILILAKALADTVLGEGNWEEIRVVKGAALEHTKYERLYDFAGEQENAWYVVCADYVTLTDGSGIVHTAPAFGEDDANTGRRYDLPLVQPVDAQGKFDDSAGFIAGKFVKDADPLIIDNLKKRGLIQKIQDYTHSYPFCWRCDTPLIYYARKSWFIAMSKVREDLMANNRSVHWMPDHIKEGRMGNFLEGVIDWGLSRERYWGTPLPIWHCEKCGKFHAVGSIEELKKLGQDVPENIELHRPYIDNVRLFCPDCGGAMAREPEVIDCWYDSGSMPFAQWHYPFENKEVFDRHFPAQFISEGIDQTRGWFYTLLAISTLLFKKSSFENCIVLGHVLDQDGRKMSKHLGNVVNPMDVMNKQSADAVRWHFYTTGAPWLPSRFYEDAVVEVQRKFLGTLMNTYAFFVMYANIDGFDPTQSDIPAENRAQMDKWALSRLHSLVRQVDDGLARYKVTETSRAIAAFVDDLSNWYVRRCRERFWGKGLEDDKLAAMHTLYEVLVTLAGLLAPFTPFLAEEIYQNLVKSVQADAPLSVHLSAFPEANARLIDPLLETNMQAVLRIVFLGRSARNAANRKVRQPLARMYVQGVDIPEDFANLVLDELNVKEIEFVTDAREFTTYNLKPQMRTLGPKYGKILPKIRDYLAAADGNSIMDVLLAGRAYSLDIEGENVELLLEDVLFEQTHKEGFAVQGEKGLNVVLDTRLNDALTQEGIARELVSKIQTQRKDLGLDVTDRILLRVESDPEVHQAAEAYGDFINNCVLAIGACEPDANGVDWDINGHACKIFLKKCLENH